ncbi:hypothetical protein [Serinicoccus kebangsaanensis]|uniref:hypothetical protein n=1 Tax=Serinicoccus kebangsaanensis TaxID=2602069 RepID=UPI00124BDF60|nr:hypothetical protein [Serinicoccus kebangsaanensis]
MERPRINQVAETIANNPNPDRTEVLGFVASADDTSVLLYLDADGRLGLEIRTEDVLDFVDPPDDESPSSFYVDPDAVLTTRVSRRLRAAELELPVTLPQAPGATGGCGCEQAELAPKDPGTGGGSSLNCYVSCNSKYRACLGLFPSEETRKRCTVRLQACRLACALWGDIGDWVTTQ